MDWRFTAVQLLLTVFLLTSSTCRKDQYVYTVSDVPFAESRFARRSTDGVDLTMVEEKFHGLRPELNTNELKNRVHSNFQFIFRNKLNRGRFLLTPAPEEVAEKIVKILHLNEQLEELIDRGQELSAEEGRPEKKKELIRSIRDVSDELFDTFRQYFLEIRPSSFTVNIGHFETAYEQFVDYILTCRRINWMLKQELEKYFLDAAPGTVDVSDFELLGVTVLSGTLQKVSSVVEKKLEQ